MRKIRGGKISMIFHNPMSSMNPAFTVGSQIAEAIRPHQNTLKHQIKSGEMLGKVGYTQAHRENKSLLTRVQWQHVATRHDCMALSCNPMLLIAYEPTTNLDVTIKAQILELMKNLRKESNRRKNLQPRTIQPKTQVYSYRTRTDTLLKK